MKPKIGRPPRAEASATALETLLLNGIDPDSIDPRAHPGDYRARSSAPPALRVSAACRSAVAEARAPVRRPPRFG